MSAAADLAATIDLVTQNLERTHRLFVAMDDELRELRRGLSAVTEQMVTEQDLIGATQDYALRSELADMQATLMEAVRAATEAPFE